MTRAEFDADTEQNYGDRRLKINLNQGPRAEGEWTLILKVGLTHHDAQWIRLISFKNYRFRYVTFSICVLRAIRNPVFGDSAFVFCHVFVDNELFSEFAALT